MLRVIAVLGACVWANLVLATSTVSAVAGDIVPDRAVVASLIKSMASDAADTDHFDAEVWLKRTEPKLQRFVKQPRERRLILHTVYAEAHKHNIDPDLVLAVMHVESYFDRFAVSRVGAQGLMQVMPFWRAEIGRDSDNLTEVTTNVRYGTSILAH